MLESKRGALTARGWKIGTAQEFLGLSDVEAEYIDLRLRLADGLKRKRLAKGVTQVELARLVRSRQSRVAKMEAGAILFPLICSFVRSYVWVQVVMSWRDFLREPGPGWQTRMADRLSKIR